MRGPVPDELTIAGTFSDGSPGVRALLACGHYGRTVAEASSCWDFPGDPETCPTCREPRQFDVRLQAYLYDS